MLVVTTLCGMGACKSTMVVGEYQCAEVSADGGPSPTDPVVLPWTMGFENGFCDYTKVAGSCYRFPPIAFRLVDYPVHSGQYAAEITVVTGTDGGAQPQGRCIRDGILPVEAYYGAWYLIPKATRVVGTSSTDRGLWNLFHFSGTNSSSPGGLWDVSLTNGPTGDGALALHLFSFLGNYQGDSPAVPIGRWFHVALYLKRAKDATGAVALYLGDEQGDEKVVEFTNIVTDDTDRGQWYVGSLASLTDPRECTVYLDDITIRSTL